MGLFGSTDNTEHERKPADRSPTNTLQRATVIAAAALVVTCLFPGYTAVLIAAIGAYEVRRVRRWWFGVWAAVTSVIGWALAGASLTQWMAWPLSQIGHTFAWILAPAPEANPIVMSINEIAESSLLSLVWMQLWGCAPAALLTTVIFASWRSHSRNIRGQIEGPEHTNRRPVGILDRRRRDRERHRIAAGHYLTPPPEPAAAAATHDGNPHA